MPLIRGQAFVIVDDQNATITLDTTSFGQLVITVQRAGSGANTTITLVLRRDGVLVNQQTLNNPTVAGCEAWISDNVSNVVGETFQFRVHFYTVQPQITATISCWDGGMTIPPVWW